MLVRRLALLSLLALALPLVAGPSARAQSLSDIRDRLAEVQSEREEIDRRIADSTQDFEALEARSAELVSDQRDLAERVEGLRGELAELSELVAMRVRETYKHGSTIEPMVVFFGSDDPEAALSRAQTISQVISGDDAKNQELAAARTRLVAAEDRLEERRAELEAARDEQAEVVASLRADFEEARQLESRLTREEREERDRLERARRDEQRRQRERDAQAAPDSASGSPSSPSSASSSETVTGSSGMACPLDQPRHFIDSWGYARSGGRSHRGTDIMGPRGTTVRAIIDGTWQIQSPGASAGLWGILRGSNGNHYWYLHLDSHTVGNGARVSAGQQVATNGATGNATAGAEHIHFELHPGGGSAVNPYSLLREVCG